MKLLKMIKLNLDRNKKYILTCSFGPDSMCLFSLLISQGYNFVIAHVNYHLRKEEADEYRLLKGICEENKIELFTIDVHMPEGVNEEGWARDIRYDFFSDLSIKLGINDVLVAHNQDDLLETYLLQLKRKSVVTYYGLKEKYNYKKCSILRPLLGYMKSELKDYCDKNQVPYGLDLSNFDITYARNKIRKEIVKDMPTDKRQELINEIKSKNSDKTLYISSLEKYIKKDLTILVDEVKNLNDVDLQMLIIMYFEKLGFYHPISLSFISEFKKILFIKSTWHKKMSENAYFCVDYGVIKLYIMRISKYKYTLLDNVFKINPNSKLYRLIENKEIMIRNGLKSSDVCDFSGVKKKINRCFIDWKVPYCIRLIWPGVFSSDGELLYVPHYQKEYKEEKGSLLLFSLDDFIK